MRSRLLTVSCASAGRGRRAVPGEEGEQELVGFEDAAGDGDACEGGGDAFGNGGEVVEGAFAEG